MVLIANQVQNCRKWDESNKSKINYIFKGKAYCMLKFLFWSHMLWLKRKVVGEDVPWEFQLAVNEAELKSCFDLYTLDKNNQIYEFLTHLTTYD